MGLYLGGNKQGGPYLDGSKVNGFIDGKKIFSSELTYTVSYVPATSSNSTTAYIQFNRPFTLIDYSPNLIAFTQFDDYTLSAVITANISQLITFDAAQGYNVSVAIEVSWIIPGGGGGGADSYVSGFFFVISGVRVGGGGRDENNNTTYYGGQFMVKAGDVVTVSSVVEGMSAWFVPYS